ncbi:hypothetical protein EsH8_I_000300 [Colletotrichum jinshuiense]
MRQLEQMQASAVSGNLTRLDNAECIQAYGHSAFQSTWKNVLLVTSAIKNDTLIDFWNHGATDKETSENWLCGLDKYDTTCDINKLAKNPAEWTISICQAEIASNEDGSYRQCDKFDAPILYCLAELFPQHCTVRVSLKLLTVVIIFNAIKVGCLLATALSRNFNPLGTVGDAISSFLEHPDDKTANLGPISMAVVKTEAWRKKFVAGGPGTSCSIKRKPRRWARAVSIRRWLLCITLCLLVWVGGLILYMMASSSAGTSMSFSEGFDGSPADMVTATLSSSLIYNVLLANTPQIIISFVYLFYNNVFTCMVFGHEYARFASFRKPLRVSRPYGQQRTTLWLQLPYRYIVPIMVTMAFLHWAVSRSIYLVQLTVFDNNGIELPNSAVDGCGYSPPAIALALCLGGVLILMLIGFSLRRLDPGIPIAGSCSLAISAAAHTGSYEADAAAHPLQYGVITQAGVDELGRRRVGFSSTPVEPLVRDEAYI